MKGKSVKKIACFVLSAALALSVVGCGDKNIVVDDYGDNSSTNDLKSERTDSLEIPLGNGASLRDVFGERVTFADEFVVDGITIKSNQSYEVPDLEGMNVYDVRLLDDGRDKEDEIVKAIFGDTAKKIEKLSYKNKEDYMSLMYKYRDIYSKTYYEDGSGNLLPTGYDVGENGELTPNTDKTTLIDSTSTVEYKWVDENKYYIHMYEGIYNGLKYGLLLAYEDVTNTRYIFLDPISINDMYPGADYKTLVVKDMKETDAEGDIENRCSKSKTEVIKDASDFLANKLMLSSDDNVVTTDSAQYKDYGKFREPEFSLGYFKDYKLASDDERDMSMLLYTDKDYITSLNKLLDAYAAEDMANGMVDFQVLAEQRDIFKEQKDANGASFLGRFIFMMDIPEEEQAKFVADGYAVYLGSRFNTDPIYNSYGWNDNSGIVKVNDSGVYGVDLAISSELAGITPNVKLMDFDSMIESVKKQLPDELNLDSASGETYVHEIELCYSQYIEKGQAPFEKKKNITIIPIWGIEIDLQKAEGVSGRILVNAMDGTIMDAYAYDAIY